MQRAAGPQFVVLHALRLKGLAEADAIAASAGAPVKAVDSMLAALSEATLVSRRDGRLSGWSLTTEGRQAHDEALAAEVERLHAREAVERLYRRFLPLNREALAVCTDWQMHVHDGRTVLNDHGDAAYDRAVLDRLAAVHCEAEPLCRELAEAAPWFSCYAPRLGHALARVRAGDFDWFTTPVMDSYHTVWFELHEDLLSTLGIERSKEESS
jgi:DNA-binding MarR family transcriptional regulator